MNFLTKILSKFHKMSDLLPGWVDEDMPKILRVTATIRKAIESPIADVVVNIIPGETDNNLLMCLRKALQVIYGSNAPQSALLDKFVKESKADTPEFAKAKLMSLASTMLKEKVRLDSFSLSKAQLEERTATDSEYRDYAQVAYTKHKDSL